MVYTLILSTIVSRHGIRAPFQPPNMTECNKYDKYSNRTFPDYPDWNMTEAEYCSQELTPHGIEVVPRMGEFYRKYFEELTPDFDYQCSKITVYADGNSTRDIQTANLLVKGMGCDGQTEVIEPNDQNVLPTVVYPVVSDHSNNLGCPLATEDQVSGLYGGDVDALTDAYSSQIQTIVEILQMAEWGEARICSDVNPSYDEDEDGTCTLFETGYTWTGQYYQGDFLSPLSYAGYFAEYFMFQYLSNLTMSDVAWGELTGSEIQELYELHTQNMFYGSNIWNARAYSSQQLGYILASMKSAIEGEAIDGVAQDAANMNVLLLVSHDFNNFYLQRLLGIDYFAKGFPENAATTTGGLKFDLVQDEDADYFVTVEYIAATPDQQRHNTSFVSGEETPSIASIVIPQCGTSFCPFETFVDIVNAAIDTACVEEPLKTTLDKMAAGGGNNNNNGGSKNKNDDDDEREKQSLQAWGISMTVLFVCLVGFIGINHWRAKQNFASENRGPTLKTPINNQINSRA